MRRKRIKKIWTLKRGPFRNIRRLTFSSKEDCRKFKDVITIFWELCFSETNESTHVKMQSKVQVTTCLHK